MFLPPNKYLRVLSFVKELSSFLTLAAVGVNDTETAKQGSWVFGTADLEGFVHALLGVGSSGNPSLVVFILFNISAFGSMAWMLTLALPHCSRSYSRRVATWVPGSAERSASACKIQPDLSPGGWRAGDSM